MSPVDVGNLEADIKLIRERRGADAVRQGDEQPPVDRIPLPSPSLMRITSGGIPLGRITRLWGDPGTGKSLVSFFIIAAAQAQGKNAAYWNVEKVYDEVHARNLGVDTKALLVEEITLIEDIAREMEILLASCHVHVVDSASAATCVDELAGDAADWTRAIDARAWKRAIRRIDNALDPNDNALIF